MFGPMLTSTVIDDIALRMLLSITTGAFWLVLILVVLNVLRIHNPNAKYFLLTIPLIKSLLALIRNIPSFGSFRGFMIINAKFPDIGQLLPSFRWELADALYGKYFHPTTTISSTALMTIIAMGIAFMIWRLIGVIRFVRLVSKADELERGMYSSFFKILDRLVAKAGIVYPKIISIESSGTPFTVGVRNPIIAFSGTMIDLLEPNEVEAVLAHEIAHISRKDHIYHWPIIILRDILFFNPITHFLFPRISFERERACDFMVSSQNKPLVLAKSLVKIAEIQASEPALKLVRRYAPQSLIAQRGSYFVRRVRELIEPRNSYALLSGVQKTLLISITIMLISIDINFVAKINGYILVLS